MVVHELATGRRTVLVNGGTDARVLPTGHLAYFREATLFAMPFDEERLMVTGGPVPVQQATDIMIATLSPPTEIRPLIKTRFGEGNPRISPDGRWIAYTSIESGRIEVYVRPFPEVDQGRWQVSTDGGFDPRWAKNGRELFFSSGGGPGPRLFWSSAIQPGVTFVAGKPTQIATSPSGAAASFAYDVASDGRLLVHLPVTSGTAAEVSRPHVVVVHTGSTS